MDQWEELKKEVKENGNVLTVSMQRLREIAGKSKLGTIVINDISRSLDGIGLGHVPEELPSSQHDLVRLYQKGSDIGDLIKTILTPGELGDKRLKQNSVNTSMQYIDMIEKIRNIVAE